MHPCSQLPGSRAWHSDEANAWVQVGDRAESLLGLQACVRFTHTNAHAAFATGCFCQACLHVPSHHSRPFMDQSHSSFCQASPHVPSHHSGPLNGPVTSLPPRRQPRRQLCNMSACASQVMLSYSRAHDMHLALQARLRAPLLIKRTTCSWAQTHELASEQRASGLPDKKGMPTK